MAFIQGSVVCLRKTMRFQTAAFATSTIVQMIARLDDVLSALNRGAGSRNHIVATRGRMSIFGKPCRHYKLGLSILGSNSVAPAIAFRQRALARPKTDYFGSRFPSVSPLVVAASLPARVR